MLTQLMTQQEIENMLIEYFADFIDHKFPIAIVLLNRVYVSETSGFEPVGWEN